MRRGILVLVMMGLLLTVHGCGAEPEEEAGISQSEFVESYAKSYCGWVFKCCSQDFDTSLLWASEGGCILDLKKLFSSITSLPADRWNSVQAKALNDALASMVQSCARPHLMYTWNDKYSILKPTKQPGDKCSLGSECITGFCKSNICANRFKAGEKCDKLYYEGQCQKDSFCMSDGICRGLVGESGTCNENKECRSFECSKNICVQTTTYYCDGK